MHPQSEGRPKSRAVFKSIVILILFAVLANSWKSHVESSVSHVVPKAVRYFVASNTIDSETNPRLLGLLRSSGHFHSQCLGGPTDLLFEILTTQSFASSHVYSYNSKNGELGDGHEWCFVPEKLRIWINNEQARAAKTHASIVVPEPRRTVIKWHSKDGHITAAMGQATY